MQNKNIQMLNYFDSALKSKLNTEYKGKSSLDIISNISEYNKYIPFNTKLNNKLFLLKKIERNLMNSNKNILTDNKKNIITNIKKDLNNKNNIMIPRNKEIINNQINKNLITRIKNINTNLKNNINLPLNIIGNPALNKKNINYLSLITSFNPEVAKLKNTVFNFNLTNNKLLKNVYTILEYSFKSMSSLISKPYLYINQDKIIIHLFFYKKVLPKVKLFRKNWNRNKLGIYGNKESIKAIKDNQKLPFLTLNKIKLENLCALLSKIFNKPVELELTQLHRIYHEPNILVNALGSIVNRIKLRRILKRLFKAIIIKNPTRLINRKRFSVIPCVLAGLSVKVAGRVMTQRVVPRKTVKFTQKGSLSRTKSIFVENARFTNKNKRGSFSITVTSGYFL
uniref:Small ribosomal subunit protein uS3m n=1 Tax=Rhizopogon vinicolor TaxID=80600 RepID=A0A4Y5SJB5_9AGAM|nr:ribosomal protein S3 [Rhizopogon vinicolor]QDA23247.1 ribosomal protein S3 [Rhizopogon vinicolor]